jgi:hypothetical protein
MGHETRLASTFDMKAPNEPLSRTNPQPGAKAVKP